MRREGGVNKRNSVSTIQTSATYKRNEKTVHSPAACGKAVGPICSNLTGHVALNCTIAQSRKNPIPYLVAIRSAPASESKMTGRTWNVLQNTIIERGEEKTSANQILSRQILYDRRSQSSVISKKEKKRVSPHWPKAPIVGDW